MPDKVQIEQPVTLAPGEEVARIGLRATLFLGAAGVFGASAFVLASPLRTLRSAPRRPDGEELA